MGATERISVAAGIIRREGRVLITRRPRGSSMEGFWEFPGGKREPGETIEECLKRELREELGIEADVGEVLVEVDYSYPGRPIRLTALVCKGFTGAPSAIGCDEFRWVEPRELELYAVCPPDRVVSQALLSNKTEEK